MNRGYTLLEMLLIMFVLSLMMLITLPKINEVNTDHYEFMNDYLITQSDAFVQKEKRYLEGYPVSFNGSGHVNMANTFSFKNHKVVITLGNGYVRVE